MIKLISRCFHSKAGCISALALSVFIALAAVPFASAASSQQSPVYRPDDPLNPVAFERFYNLDYDRAVEGFEKVLQRHPDDPFAVNHLLTAVLFRELYRMGALDTGEYANDSFVNAAHRPPDPKAQQRIKDLVAQALKLEEKRLDANDKDVDALYARGVTRAQFSTYTALVERAWLSALRNAVGARHDHERVLELAPGYVDAKLVVGAHNYVTGSLPWAVKIAVSMVGLGGSKEKGLDYLRQVADSRGENSVDARIVLILFLRREHREAESLALTQDLVRAYPQNLLMLLEEGNLLRALGRPQEAEQIYRKIFDDGRHGHFPNLHYEIAAVALGDLLRNQKDRAGAAAAYERVNEVPTPEPEASQKANLAAGEMYDLLQQRDLALKKYEAVIALKSTTAPAETARRHIKDPYRE